MTTEPRSKRTRRTDDEVEAALKAKLADLAVKRRAVLKRHMETVADGLDVIATTNLDVGPIASEAKGLAVRLRSWA